MRAVTSLLYSVGNSLSNKILFPLGYSLYIIIRLFSNERGIITDINIEVQLPEGGGNVALSSC